MSHQLSEGSLEVIMNGGHFEKPIMQVLGSKKIQGSGANERFRLLVSDGKHSHSFAMLATQLNDKLISGELSDYSVVQIDRFVTSLLKNTGKGEKRVMIILEVTIVSPGSEVGKKLGNPQTWTEESSTAAPVQATASPAAPARPSLAPAPKSIPTPTPNLDSSLLSGQMTHPIASLSPYQNKKILARKAAFGRRWIKLMKANHAISTPSNVETSQRKTNCQKPKGILATKTYKQWRKIYDLVSLVTSPKANSGLQTLLSSPLAGPSMIPTPPAVERKVCLLRTVDCFLRRNKNGLRGENACVVEKRLTIEEKRLAVEEKIASALEEINDKQRSTKRVWVIKARVMNKSDIRTWNNARGEGKLFSMDLCDDSGEIRATAFKAECDKYYDMIQIDKVYYISRCQLKTANKQYTSIKNDYEMTFTANTVVAECMDDSSSVPSVKYEFMPINDIADKSADTLLDVVGVCKSAADLQELTARNTGKLLKKREVTLVDNSGGAIVLTMWGKEAENFQGDTNPVIAIKGARLTEFNGSKSLSCLASTMIRLNPDLPEAHQLRGWYDNGGADAEIINISARAGGYTGGSNEWITFSDAEARQLGSGEKGDYFSLLGVLTFTFSDNAVYKACPQEQCNKKLVDQENGLYRCEKCNREYPNYKYRLLLAANVSDPTGDQRITAFNEAAEAMLGKNVADVGRMFEYDKTAYTQMFEEVKFRTFVFKFRTKMETYNDEARLKTTVINVQPVDYKDGNKKLIASIKTITGVEV